MNIRFTPLSAAIGAEVNGIDLRQSISDETFEKLSNALVKYQVLCFREQAIEPSHQKALADRFGPLQTHPAYNTVEGFPEITILESTSEKPTKIEKWHSDMTFLPHPPQATMLRSRVIPAVGGDTLWSSMTAAYRGLSAKMQDFLSDMTAVHDFSYGFKETLADPGEQERLAAAIAANPAAEHPVIRTHPESGEKLIFVNELFTTHIKNLALDESEHLLSFLYRHIQKPEYCCRFRWSNDALVLWDNRSTQHKPVNDYFPAHRRMERITIDGDKPY
jgi:taurine dioxygenase